MQIVVINGIEYAPLIKKEKKSKDDVFKRLVNYYMKEILKSNIFKSKN